MKVARIIPLLRLVRGLDIFDYSVPDTLPSLVPGIVVRIPFRAKKVRGIVIEIKEVKTQRALKPILGIVSNEPMIAPHTLRFAKALQKETLAPLSLLLRIFLPHIPTRPKAQWKAPPTLGAYYESLRIPKTSLRSIKKCWGKKVRFFTGIAMPSALSGILN